MFVHPARARPSRFGHSQHLSASPLLLGGPFLCGLLLGGHLLCGPLLGGLLLGGLLLCGLPLGGILHRYVGAAYRVHNDRSREHNLRGYHALCGHDVCTFPFEYSCTVLVSPVIILFHSPVAPCCARSAKHGVPGRTASRHNGTHIRSKSTSSTVAEYATSMDS